MKYFVAIVLSSLLMFSGLTIMTVKAEEQVYGWQLMTEQERIAHQEKMRTLKTAEEKERYRMEHHKMMQERAKERGVTLPEMPGPQGKGMGPGPGAGPGPGKCGGGGKK